VKKYDHRDEYVAFSALLDKGAEMFTKKKFKHSQSKAQQSPGDAEKGRRDKMSAIRSGSPAGRV
jgi:hypothetical protein